MTNKDENRKLNLFLCKKSCIEAVKTISDAPKKYHVFICAFVHQQLLDMRPAFVESR